MALNDNRVQFIDVAKGISICLVAMFHSQLLHLIPQIIVPMGLFRMPLFFFLSGVFFSFKPTPGVFFLKKAEALLKPYFAVLLTVMVVTLLTETTTKSWSQLLIGLFYGVGNTLQWVPLWFLPHLFALYGFGYLICRYTPFTKLPVLLRYSVLMLMLVMGTVTVDLFWEREVTWLDYPNPLPGLPFSIDLLFITSVYFLLGALLRNSIIHFTPNFIALSLAFLVLVLIICYTDATINLNRREYLDPVFATFGALCGIYTVLSIAWGMGKIHWLRKSFSIIGSASLFILIFHNWIGENLYKLLASDQPDSVYNFVLGLFTLLLSISVPILIKWVVAQSNFLSLFFFPVRSNHWFQLQQKMS